MVMVSILVDVTTVAPVIIADPLLSIHPLASMTLRVYVPGFKEEILAVVAPFDHK